MTQWLLWCAERNVLIAAAGFSLSLASFIWLGEPVEWGVVGLIAGGAFLVYHLDRGLPFSPEDGKSRASRQPLLLLFLAAAGYGLAAWFLVKPALRPAVVGLLALTAAYLAPCLPGRKRFKEVPYLKAFYVALIWTLATVWLPAAAARAALRESLLLGGYRFLFLLPNALLFDWPDREGDGAAGIVTLATVFDEQRLRRLCAAITVIAVAASVCAPLGSNLPWSLPTENLASLLQLLALRHPLPDRPFFYRVFLDGLTVWPGVAAGWSLIISHRVLGWVG